MTIVQVQIIILEYNLVIGITTVNASCLLNYRGNLGVKFGQLALAYAYHSDSTFL